MIQKVIRVGNSAAVTIPKSMLKETGLKIGSTVSLSYKADEGNLIVDLSKKKRMKAPVKEEFQHWLKQFLAEDRELLEELASR